jgi:hypothetical protein
VVSTDMEQLQRQMTNGGWQSSQSVHERDAHYHQGLSPQRLDSTSFSQLCEPACVKVLHKTTEGPLVPYK